MTLDRDECSRLMDSAATGRTEAFSPLAEAVQDDLFRVALRRGLADADAAEVVQETLTRAYAGRQKWQSGRDAVAWLRGIAANVAREWLRRPRPTTVAEDVAASPASRPERDEMEAMRTAVAALPDRQREALVLTRLEGLSVREAAETMNCAEGTVKAAVHAAMENLRKRLRPSQ